MLFEVTALLLLLLFVPPPPVPVPVADASDIVRSSDETGAAVGWVSPALTDRLMAE